MRRNIGKKTWGVLGKQQTYFYQPGLVAKNGKTPLNANAFEPWDAKKSKYRRIDLMPRQLENDGQQSGVAEDTSAPIPSPTPTITSTQTPTPTNTQTPTNTGTNTPTPSITPSSTPAIPVPILWYDASDATTLTLTNSGGTNYITAWASKGTSSKTLTATTINTAPIYSGSSTLPSSPNIVRFTENATAGNRDFLASQYNSDFISNSGSTIFQVLAKPTNATAMAAAFRFYSGNTSGGFVAPSTKLIINSTLALNGLNQSQVLGYTGPNNTFPLQNTTAYTRGDNYLLTNVSAVNSGEFMNSYVNEFYSASTTAYIALTAGTGTNAVILNGTASQTGVITAGNSSNEVAEILYYNRVLSPSEITQVQNYLKTKWNYSNWIPPTPTPTPTTTQTQTPTTTTTQTPTNTGTPTPTPSIIPSGTTQAQTYLSQVVASGGTVNSAQSAATITLFTSLVSNNLWDKLYAFYPTLGGVAASHRINGRSSTGQYNLTYYGGWTHTSSGMQPNGTNGYADTSFIPNTVLGTSASSLGIYVNLQGSGSRIYDMGCANSDSLLTAQFAIAAKRAAGNGNNTLFDAGDYNPNGYGRVDTTSQASASGMTIGSVRSTTDRTLYRNGTNIATQGGSRNITYSSRELILGAMYNDGGIAYFSDNRYGFVFIGSGLTNTDIVNLSSIINTYQTALGRNTY